MAQHALRGPVAHRHTLHAPSAARTVLWRRDFSHAAERARAQAASTNHRIACRFPLVPLRTANFARLPSLRRHASHLRTCRTHACFNCAPHTGGSGMLGSSRHELRVQHAEGGPAGRACDPRGTEPSGAQQRHEPCVLEVGISGSNAVCASANSAVAARSGSASTASPQTPRAAWSCCPAQARTSRRVRTYAQCFCMACV